MRTELQEKFQQSEASPIRAIADERFCVIDTFEYREEEKGRMDTLDLSSFNRINRSRGTKIPA